MNPLKLKKICFNKSIQKEKNVSDSNTIKKKDMQKKNLEKEKCKNLYLKQKIKIQAHVRETAEKHEEKETK